MPESDEKFIVKDIVCPNPKCCYSNHVAIVKEGQVLSERYQILLRNSGIRITKKGATFACQHCGKKINAD